MTCVLVIDDEAPIRLLCRVNLEAEKMEVLEAADGPTGLEQARAAKPDVILLDVMMPGLDGWQVAEQLLEDDATKSIPSSSSPPAPVPRPRARLDSVGSTTSRSHSIRSSWPRWRGHAHASRAREREERAARSSPSSAR